MRFFLTLICSSLISFCSLKAQDYVLPLTTNPELYKNSSATQLKNNSTTFDSTIIYITDTLALPFFDEFTKNNFQEYTATHTSQNTTNELFYSLLDDENENPLAVETLYTDQSTYFLTVDLVNDTLIYDYFDSTTFLYSDLSSYPVSYQSRYGYPPYRIVDTITADYTVRDTFWIDVPRFFQDSARIFIAKLNEPSKLWLNKKAYHNYRFAKKPWSLGVVTFDGLNENGRPYIFGPTNITMTCDTLLAKPLNLSINSPSDSIYFSFLYQTEGYGDIPEDTDSLYLDFFNPTKNQWQRVWRAGGAPVSDFKVAHIPIKNPDYFKNGFQFRFMNYGSPAGSLDHFHIDYVDIRTLSGYQDTLFKDFAFVYPISTLLKDYTSVPWKHYRNHPENKMSDQVAVTVRNGSELPENNQNGTLRIFHEEQEEGSFTLNATLLSGGNINYEPRSTYVSLHDFSNGYAFDHQLTNDTSATFDWIANASAQFPSYPANDSTIGKQEFKNFYAYDDGTAEKAYGVFGIQSELAYRFNAYQEDSLIAVQMHFVPTVVDVSNNLFLLAVWNDNNGRPGTKIYEDQFFFPKLPIYTNEKNKFHTYFFDDTAKIAVGETFYVGWRQIDEDRMNIGFDMNHDNSEHIFWSIDGGNQWNNASFQGSLMIRPVVTSNLDHTLNIKKKSKPQTTLDFTVYPNPTQNYFNIKIETHIPLEVLIFDLNGRLIQEGKSDETFYVNDFKKGIYFVSIFENGRKLNTKKLIIH
jgi:hypothetical protein